MTAQARTAIETSYRQHWSRLLALLTRQLRDLDMAEEALADAYATALFTWEANGVPENAEAWLLTVARNRARDWQRRDATHLRKLPLLAVEEEVPGVDELFDDEGSTIPDERLRLFFTCCHPALAAPAQVALTLRYVGMLTTAEIAHAFLVSEPTMAARISRAKKKIALARIPYRVPRDAELPERLASVLSVIYLVFNEGYSTVAKAPVPARDLCLEAIRLGRVLAGLMPDEPEVLGLLALMSLHRSRAGTRVDADGRLVLLPNQDRGRWDRALIGEGCDLVRRAVRAGGCGRFVLEAAIAAEHARAGRPEDTDWTRIGLLYEDLEGLTRSPIVRLNRAVALAQTHGPAAGLALLDGLDGSLAGYHLLPAVRADLLRRLGRAAEAAADYQRALQLATSEADRQFLRDRLAELAAPTTLGRRS